MSEILNAKITNVTISMADHGCLTYGLSMDIMGGYACVFGGISIGYGYLGSDTFEGSKKGLEAIMRIMDVVGVERWEDLKGEYCRVVSDGWGSIIHKIGNILKDKWFDQKEFFENNREA